ncbi:hypothetical protein FBU30_010467 [Linnemannia zychae]|nr:hypothetical protein FBU30_010467 [Linnemannia zychae]
MSQQNVVSINPVEGEAQQLHASTTSVKPTSVIAGRKLSITDKLLAGAEKAAATATNAATSAVAAARRLVGDESTEIDLDPDTPDTIPAGEPAKGGMFGLLKSTTDNGLQFSQRRLSVDKQKSQDLTNQLGSLKITPVSTTPNVIPVDTTTTQNTIPFTVTHTTVYSDAHNIVQNDTPTIMQNPGPVHTQTTASTNTQNVLPASVQPTVQTTIQPSVPTAEQTTVQTTRPVTAPSNAQNVVPVTTSTTNVPVIIQDNVPPHIQTTFPTNTQNTMPTSSSTTTTTPINIPKATQDSVFYTYQQNSALHPLAGNAQSSQSHSSSPTRTSASSCSSADNSTHRRPSIVSQDVVLNEDHKTLYVTNQSGPRNQALGVDKPSISSTSETMKAQSPTGLRVDKPMFIGAVEDPNIQNRRRGSLHVDKVTGFSNDPNDTHNLNDLKDSSLKGEQNTYTEEVIETDTKPNPPNDRKNSVNSSPRIRRKSSFSGLNVDRPAFATDKIAGSGSTNETNQKRPEGIYNSGYNVDRPGSKDQKMSGLGVDKPNVVIHQMASVKTSQKPPPPPQGLKFNTQTTNNTQNKYYNHDDAPVHPYSTTTTTETVVNPAELGPTITYQPPINMSSSAPTAPLVIPAGYTGPIPQIAPGEEVIWVKKTIRTQYYDDDGIQAANGLVPPAPAQETGRSGRRGSVASLIDRIRGRRTSAVSAEKGKERQ